MRSKCVLLMAVLLTPVSFVSMVFPQTQSGSGAVAEVTRLQKESVKADLANDSSSFIKKYYADDYTSGSSFGDWDTKTSMLKDYSDPKGNKTNKEELSDLQVRAYGDNTAIANYKETYDSLYHGEHRARSVICTSTWVKQGTWKLVADHCSQLAK